MLEGDLCYLCYNTLEGDLCGDMLEGEISLYEEF